MMTEGDEDPRKLTVADIVIDSFYVIAIGVNVYIIMDQATDGALSTAVKLRVERVRAGFSAKLKARREYRLAVGTMLLEAMDAVETKEK